MSTAVKIVLSQAVAETWERTGQVTANDDRLKRLIPLRQNALSPRPYSAFGEGKASTFTESALQQLLFLANVQKHTTQPKHFASTSVERKQMVRFALEKLGKKIYIRIYNQSNYILFIPIKLFDCKYKLHLFAYFPFYLFNFHGDAIFYQSTQTLLFLSTVAAILFFLSFFLSPLQCRRSQSNI